MSRAKLAGVNVSLLGDSSRVLATATTDSAGRFLMRFSRAGAYTIRLGKPGYLDQILGPFTLQDSVHLAVIAILGRGRDETALSRWVPGRLTSGVLSNRYMDSFNSTALRRQGTIAWTPFPLNSAARYVTGYSSPLGLSYGRELAERTSAGNPGPSGVLRFGTPVRSITTDSLVQLAAAQFPQLFTDSTTSDGMVVAIALDSTGRVMHSRMAGHAIARTLDDGISLAEHSNTADNPGSERNAALNQIIPEIANYRRLASGSLKGTVRPRGLAAKRIVLIFAVVAR